MIIKKLILIVLYKCSIEDSSTIKSILNCQSELSSDDKLLIWDNSPINQSQKDIDELITKFNSKIEYKNTPENISLSKIYNFAITQNQNFDFIILFDQDSIFDYYFFSKFKLALQDDPELNLFLPLIESNGKIISPGYFRSFKGSHWKDRKFDKILSKNMMALSSGMIIKMTVFNIIGLFDENLLFYGIDTNFFLRFRKYFTCFYVLDVYFNHNISDFNKEDLKTKIWRFNEFKKSSIYNSKLFPFYVQWLTILFLIYKAFKNCLTYKTLLFIRLF